MIALWVIGFNTLIAIFAYPLAPDNSPNANREIVELKARPAGFSSLFVEVPRTGPVAQKTFFSRLFTGTPPRHDLVPVTTFFFARDTLYVAHYIDAGRQDTLAYSLRRLLTPAQQKRSLGDQQLAVFNHAIRRHTFLLGTDSRGRDIFSRLLIGLRVSLAAGIIAGLLSLAIGMLLGSVAGYFSIWVGKVITYLINVLTAIPALILVFAITLGIGKSFFAVCIAIGLAMWAGVARIIRGQVVAVRGQAYVQAAHTLGFSRLRILLRHILPNIAGPLWGLAASNIAVAIIMEAGLSFLGLGVREPVPSLGLMTREHYDSLLANHSLPALLPGIVVIMLAGAFNVLANNLRDEESG